MLKNETWSSSDYRKVIKLTVLLVLLTISGCGGGGENNPITSNLSTTPSTEAETDLPSSEDVASLPEDLHVDDLYAEYADDLQAGDVEAPVDTPDSSPDGQTEQNPPPQPPSGSPVVALNSTSTGASVDVTWQPSLDSNVNGYYIYYGRQSSGESGVCSYEERYAVDSSTVTLTGLEPNTPYFFAVSSHSNYESPCSNETAIVTPPARA